MHFVCFRLMLPHFLTHICKYFMVTFEIVDVTKNLFPLLSFGE